MAKVDFKIVMVMLIVIGIVLTGLIINKNKNNEEAKRYQAILALKPLGYWPANEGRGDLLIDHSGKGNNGKIYNVPWENGLLNFNSRYQWVEIPILPEYQGNTFSIGGWIYTRITYADKGMTFIGSAMSNLSSVSFSIHITAKNIFYTEVVIDDKAVVLDSISNEIKAARKVAPMKWHHVMFTFDNGVGSLYIDGSLVQTASGITSDGLKYPLMIGYESRWWEVTGSKSLDGTVQDIVLFDRRLSPESVQSIYDATIPKEIELSTTALASIHPSNGSIKAATSAIKYESLRQLINIFNDSRSTQEQRIETALALGKMGKDAEEAIPALVKTMEDILEQEGSRMPRIEDRLRNAVLRALLDIDPKDERARHVLGKSLAEPLLLSLDLSSLNMLKVNTLLNEGKTMDALELYRQTSMQTNRYFSQGDPSRDARVENSNGRAYTPVATWNGYTYQIGTGEVFRSASAISGEDYQNAVAGLVADYPEVKTWRKDNTDLYRLKITKTGSDGSTQSVFLEGDKFIFDGTDQKVQGWSIAADKNGYLHLMGGQHNTPNPNCYIPGSWEKMGLSRVPGKKEFPAQMYWISKIPGDITSFEFAGRTDDPRSLPASYWNYMNFVQDRKESLYAYGRINTAGKQSWGLFLYNIDLCRWEALGGDASRLAANAKAAYPDWSKYLIRPIRGEIPTTPQPNTLVWAWIPHFYNYCRAPFGVYFDITNRMHINMGIQGIGESGQIIYSNVYAWSDDGGKTFYRADGSLLALPLTVNPAPDHNADINNHDTLKWWGLWSSLLKEVNYIIPKFDSSL